MILVGCQDHYKRSNNVINHNVKPSYRKCVELQNGFICSINSSLEQKSGMSKFKAWRICYMKIHGRNISFNVDCSKYDSIKDHAQPQLKYGE